MKIWTVKRYCKSIGKVPKGPGEVNFASPGSQPEGGYPQKGGPGPWVTSRQPEVPRPPMVGQVSEKGTQGGVSAQVSAILNRCMGKQEFQEIAPIYGRTSFHAD